MNSNNFKQYTVEDFVLDKDFIKLVRNPDEADNLRLFKDSLPEKRYEIYLATQIIKGLQVEKYTTSDDFKNKSWQKIVNKKKRHISFAYMKYAAAVMLLVTSTFSIYYITSKDVNNVTTASNIDLLHLNENNTNDAILILSNGDVVPIQSKESSLTYSSDGSKIKVNNTESIGQDVGIEGVNKLIVPFGKRSTVTLSDGTKVWLNSGSTFTFPPTFTGKSREVQLVGEAYFDVTHNKNKPFYVKTDAFKLKVYGTKFDIQAYRQDIASSIVLVEGKVSMTSNKDKDDCEVFLAPNQRATIIDGNSSFDINKVENIDVYTSWTEGYLTFANEDISQLLKQVSRYYNVEIDINNGDKIDKIYGKLDLKEDLEKVLEGISFISKTNYRKIGDKYEFY